MLNKLIEGDVIYSGNIPEINGHSYIVDEYALRMITIMDDYDRIVCPKHMKFFAKKLCNYLHKEKITSFPFSNIKFYNTQEEQKMCEEGKTVINFFSNERQRDDLNDKLIFKKLLKEKNIQTPEFEYCQSAESFVEGFHALKQKGYEDIVVKFRNGFAGANNFIIYNLNGILEVLAIDRVIDEMRENGLILEGCLDIQKYDSVNLNYFIDPQNGTLKNLGHSQQMLLPAQNENIQQLFYVGSRSYDLKKEDEVYIAEQVEKIFEGRNEKNFMGIDLLIDKEGKLSIEFLETNCRINFSLVPVTLAKRFDLNLKKTKWIFTSFFFNKFKKFKNVIKNLKKENYLFRPEDKEGAIITNYYYKNSPKVDLFIATPVQNQIRKIVDSIESVIRIPDKRCLFE